MYFTLIRLQDSARFLEKAKGRRRLPEVVSLHIIRKLSGEKTSLFCGCFPAAWHFRFLLKCTCRVKLSADEIVILFSIREMNLSVIIRYISWLSFSKGSMKTCCFYFSAIELQIGQTLLFAKEEIWFISLSQSNLFKESVDRRNRLLTKDERNSVVSYSHCCALNQPSTLFVE